MRFLLAIVFFFSSSQVDDELKLKSTIATKADRFSTDNIGNVYIVKGPEIIKYDRNGELQNTYSNKLFGEISSIDASNPLKVVIFYEHLKQVVFLDTWMSVQGGAVPLEEHNLEQVTHVCYSHNNGLWVYDLNTAQLIRLDQEFHAQQETGNLIQVLGYQPNPNFLVERNNWVYLNDPETGILVFDIYGTYAKTIPIKGLSGFQIMEGFMYYLKDKKLMAFDMELLEEKEVKLPVVDFSQLRIEKDGLFLLTEKGLQIYSAGS